MTIFKNQTADWLIIFLGAAVLIFLLRWESRLEDHACALKVNNDLKTLHTREDTIAYANSGVPCLR